jgi:Protein of unknown function (DUF4197)
MNKQPLRHAYWLSFGLFLLFSHTATLLSAQDSTQKQQPAQQQSGLGGFGRFLQKVIQPTGNNTSTGLTATEIANGLKQALEVGISNGSAKASAVDGYFKNPLLKIAFPPEAQKVASTLRQVGFSRQVDDFELSLNRAAEDAAKRAKPVFIKAITSMSIQDAVGILRGDSTAATRYLRQSSGQQLVAEFTPIVDSTLRKNNATRLYSSLVSTYNQLPMVQKVNPNLTEYATNRAVDGLFILVAQEEKKIRENPLARVTDLLKRVFGK